MGGGWCRGGGEGTRWDCVNMNRNMSLTSSCSRIIIKHNFLKGTDKRNTAKQEFFFTLLTIFLTTTFFVRSTLKVTLPYMYTKNLALNWALRLYLVWCDDSWDFNTMPRLLASRPPPPLQVPFYPWLVKFAEDLSTQQFPSALHTIHTSLACFDSCSIVNRELCHKVYILFPNL